MKEKAAEENVGEEIFQRGTKDEYHALVLELRLRIMKVSIGTYFYMTAPEVRISA